LQYLSIMGPQLVAGIRTGTFDGAAWGAAVAAAAAKDFDGICAELAKLSDLYATEVGKFSEADFGEEMDFFGQKHSRGYHMVNLVASGHAAYRTQLFCYLKSNGRDELNTYNLWGGVDGEMAA
ncbi:MAG: hypothetical protein ABI995_11955, partial [Acidobacteriota bacterium]